MQDQPAPEIGLLRAAYAAFNARDIDAALALMTSNVAWPKAFKGGFVRGPEEVRAYWTEQWREIDPHVEPVACYPEKAGRILVDLHQVVRDLDGAVLADEHVGHRFTLEGGLIQGMEVCGLPSANGSSEAKAKR
ncbi:MAG: nuclear transport factor 2 family protein [Verrucomicrobiota bacterium]